MDQLVGIIFNGETVSMPGQNLSAEEIAKLFNTKENVLHVKVRKDLLWESIWPTGSSEIKIPENITTALLIAIPNYILPDPEEEMRTRPVKVNAFTASCKIIISNLNLSLVLAIKVLLLKKTCSLALFELTPYLTGTTLPRKNGEGGRSENIYIR